MPSSRSRAHTWAGARSQYSGERSTVSTCWRSGLGQLVRRCRPRRRRARHRWPAPPVARRSRRPQQRAGLLHRRRRGEIVEMGVDHGFDFESESALSESSSKSACAFPVISNASFVRASSASSRSLRRRSRSSSTCSAERRAFALRRQRVAGAGVAGLTPLRQMRAVQALAAQQRTPLGRADRQRVVLVEDPGLVLGGERSPPRPGRRVGLVHHPIMGAREQRRRGHGHRSTCSRLALQGWSATAGVSRQPDRPPTTRSARALRRNRHEPKVIR